MVAHHGCVSSEDEPAMNRVEMERGHRSRMFFQYIIGALLVVSRKASLAFIGIGAMAR